MEAQALWIEVLGLENLKVVLVERSATVAVVGTEKEHQSHMMFEPVDDTDQPQLPCHAPIG